MVDRWNGFKGQAKRIEDDDLPRIARTIGVGEDELHAFMDVEAAGTGFDKQGRPKMLFEPHVFWRNLPKALRSTAQAQGLAYPKWRRGAYPNDSYPRLYAAMAIHEEAALKACSWGLSQILGENYRIAGYDTPEAMVRAFMDDEDNHLEATVLVLVSMGIDDDLRAHRWEVVARYWNGPGYREHGYHTRLAAAFARWQRIKDTPYNPELDTRTAEAVQQAVDTIATAAKEMSAPFPAPPVVEQPRSVPKGKWAEEELAKFEIEAIQKRLRDLGYHMVGYIDGKWGPSTEGAIKALQAQAKISEDGHWGPATKAALADDTNRRKVSQARASATVRSLVAQGSQVATLGVRARFMSKVVTIVPTVFALIGFIANNWDAAQSLIDPFAPLFGALPIWATWVPVALAGLYLWAQANGVLAARVASERSGRHNGEDAAPYEPVPMSTSGSNSIMDMIAGVAHMAHKRDQT